MKKFIILSLISLIFTSQAFAETEEDKKVVDELQNMQDTIFSAPISPLTEVDYSIKAVEDSRIGRISPKKDVMPLFKQIRIKIQNHYRTKAYEEAQRLLEEERKEAEALKASGEDPEDIEEEIHELTLRQIKEITEPESEQVKKEKKIFSFFKKDKTKEKETSEEKATQDVKKDDSKQENITEEKPEVETEKDPNTLELSGSVKKLNSPKDAQLDCEVLEYIEDREELEATGHPVLYFPPQDVTLKADKLVYNTASDVIKAYGNVELIKNGNSVFGDFIQINMNEETSILHNLRAHKNNLIINAEKVKAKDNQIELEKGNLSADSSYILRFKTRIIGSDLNRMLIDEDEKSTLLDKEHSKVTVVAKDVLVEAKKDHDIITVKNADITYNDHHLFNINNLKIYTNKKQDYFEGNYPEFGSRSRIGMFLGPGFVFGIPNGGTMKVIPFLNYKDEFGIGGALKYRSSTNTTEFMYGSAENIAVLRGQQQFDDKFMMQYGINSYMDDWFMGRRMAKYMAELLYQDGVRLKNFAGPNHDLTFKHRLGAGYVQDSDVNRFDEKSIKSSELGTTRFKYMAELSQNIFNYEDKDNLKIARLDVVMQGSAAVYGTGDTQFLGRIGPRLHTQYKYWMQDIGYFQSAYEDNTPVPRFDTYRYGKSSVYLREALRLNKYLAVAWSTTLNLSGDAPNGDMFQENAFMFALGPDDFKVNIGYDIFRQTTYFGVNVALDMKGTNVHYDKLVIKNPDKLGNDDKKEVKEISFENKTQQIKPVRKYAEVIDIEDPNKEEI